MVASLLGRVALGAEVGLPDNLASLELLKRGAYETLDRRVSTYQEAFEAELIPDTLVDYAFSIFAASDPAMESRLTAWIERMPESSAARVARGKYYSSLGWASRGGALARRTHERLFAAMDRYFALAKRDYEIGLSIRAKLSIATADLINIAMAQGRDRAVERLVEEGLEAVPRSAVIRRRYMDSLRPWWGGSLDLIDQFMENTKQAHPDDDLLREIYQYHNFSRAISLDRDGREEDALELMDRVVAQSDYWLYRTMRANLLADLERYHEALSDFDLVFPQRPQVASLFDDRAQVHHKLGDTDAAFVDWDAALALDPFDPRILRHRANALRDLGRYEEAVAFLNQAKVVGFDYTRVRDARGVILLYDLDRPAEALADFKHAIELRPDSKRYWYNYARALFAVYDCESTHALARYWDICDGGAQCSEENVEWAKAVVFGSLHHTSCWPAFTRSFAPLTRIALRKLIQ